MRVGGVALEKIVGYDLKELMQIFHCQYSVVAKLFFFEQSVVAKLN